MVGPFRVLLFIKVYEHISSSFEVLRKYFCSQLNEASRETVAWPKIPQTLVKEAVRTQSYEFCFLPS